MKNRFTIYILVSTLLLLSSCSLIRQRQLSSRLTADWHIEQYEILNDDGRKVVIDDAGTIELNSDGRGRQTFQSSFVPIGQLSDNQFTWDIAERAVFIRTRRNQPRKVWIIVESSRTFQTWYSSDDEGNVQILKLRRK
jgi:hypothetical protein